MDARRTWAAPLGTGSAEAPPYSHLEALRARWRVFTAELRGPAVADPVAQRAPRQPALACCAAPAETGELGIHSRRYEHGLYVLVSGPLDAATEHELRQQCDRIDPRVIETVVLDLGDVTYMDANGLGALLAAFAHLGERLVIIVSPPCAHAIHVARVRDWLPIIEG
jgi:anti-anti-sigma factor